MPIGWMPTGRSVRSNPIIPRCPKHAAMQGTLLGMMGWVKHVIRLVGFNAPMPATAVETCVAPSHYAKELKERAQSHQAHILLFYVGYEDSPFDRDVALAAAAGVLGRLGALVVLNESGHTSLPAAVLSGSNSEGDRMDHLGSLPLLLLYCGFVKLEVERHSGSMDAHLWSATVQLPDLAAHATRHEDGQRYFDLFETIFGYLRESGSQIAAGDTMQIDHEDLSTLSRARNRRRLPYGCRGLACRRHTACQ